MLVAVRSVPTPGVAHRLLTGADVSEQLNLSSSTVNRLRQSGALASVRVSPGRFRFRQEDIDRYVEDRLEILKESA